VKGIGKERTWESSVSKESEMGIQLSVRVNVRVDGREAAGAGAEESGMETIIFILDISTLVFILLDIIINAKSKILFFRMKREAAEWANINMGKLCLLPASGGPRETG